MALAFVFLGPLPIIPVDTILSLVQAMVGFFAFGYASVVVSSFGRAQTSALNLGYLDDISTYIMISGELAAYIQYTQQHYPNTGVQYQMFTIT